MFVCVVQCDVIVCIGVVYDVGGGVVLQYVGDVVVGVFGFVVVDYYVGML